MRAVKVWLYMRALGFGVSGSGRTVWGFSMFFRVWGSALDHDISRTLTVGNPAPTVEGSLRCNNKLQTVRSCQTLNPQLLNTTRPLPLVINGCWLLAASPMPLFVVGSIEKAGGAFALRSGHGPTPRPLWPKLQLWPQSCTLERACPETPVSLN